MIHLVFDRPDVVVGWVSERVGSIISPPYVAIGATKDGHSLCGGAVFNRWNGHNIDITLASEGCMTRGTIRAIFHYAFVQSRAGRITAITRRSNKVMRAMLPRFGFVPEYGGQPSKRYYGPNKSDDAFSFVLLPENARKYL